MFRHCLIAIALATPSIMPALAQQDCAVATADDGSEIYVSPSSEHEVAVNWDVSRVFITLGDISQTCNMSFEDRSNAGLGNTWFAANTIKCKTFTAQMSYVSPRDGGEMLMILDGMTFYPKCAQ